MFKFLLIEDAEEDIESCKDTVKRMNLEAGEEIFQISVAESYDEGIEGLKNDYDGIIIDIKLDGEHSGNEIIRTIIKKYRVPVAVMTGTPDTELEEGSPICIYKKGETSYENIINSLYRSSSTGLFNVLGGTGIIEKVMNQIFWKNLYPQIGLWEDRKGHGVDTEKVLLRYAISHIQELIDSEIPAYVTEEMYIKPPIAPNIKTGSIVQAEDDGLYCIVLSPPCDLAMHNEKMKTERVLLCEIDTQDDVHSKLLNGITNSNKRAKKIATALNNNYTDFYHWLPQNSLFNGGYINFRKVITYSPEDISKQFSPPLLKVQESFVKSILGRFSAYYARQGQPDFDFNTEATTIVEKIPMTV